MPKLASKLVPGSGIAMTVIREFFDSLLNTPISNHHPRVISVYTDEDGSEYGTTDKGEIRPVERISDPFRRPRRQSLPIPIHSHD